MKRDIRFGIQWRVLVDIATVVWLIIFAFSFAPSAPFSTVIADRIGIALLAVFIADLGVTYYRAAEPPLPFLRHHWFDVLLVIPYFRIFRILRVVRFLRFLRLLQQPRPAVAMRLFKTALNSIKGAKKAKRTVKETSSLIEHRE